MDEKPKQRPLTIDIHVLAYLGDYITMIEKAIKTMAEEKSKEIPKK